MDNTWQDKLCCVSLGYKLLSGKCLTRPNCFVTQRENNLCEFPSWTSPLVGGFRLKDRSKERMQTRRETVSKKQQRHAICGFKLKDRSETGFKQG